MNVALIATTENNAWWVYILRCRNGALYTGVSTDVQRRVGEHADQGRRSARFTRAFAPVELVYTCRIGSKSRAYRVEYRIKRLSRGKKAALVAEQPTRRSLLGYLSINR